MPIRYSYSGADCKAVAYFDNNSNYDDVADKNGLKITDVIQRPIDNLLEYHKKNINQ